MVLGDTLVASELRIRRALWRVRRLPWSGRSRLLSDRSPTPQPELIPNLALQNLAVGVARQEVPNLDRFWRFDAAQRFPAESNDLRRVDLETCVGFDDGLYRLAPWSVGLICCSRLLLLDAQVHW
jgi:hypothetical protein